MSHLTFDIETGLDDIDQALEAMPPFDTAAVKTGSMGPEKAAEKIEKLRKEHAAKWLDGAGLNALIGRVLCIGINAGGKSISATKVIHNDESEEQLLNDWWALAHDTHRAGGVIVGFNSHQFDVPFLVRRSLQLGVYIPPFVRKGRYLNDCFVDIAEVWTCGERGRYIKLDDLARAMGIPGKPEGLDGSMFAGLWRKDRKKAIEYVQADVSATHEIALRFNVI